MRNFKTMMMLIAISILMIPSLIAQNQPTKDTAIMELLGQLEEVYDLNVEQKGAVKKLVTAYINEREAIRHKEFSSVLDIKAAYSEAANNLLDSVEKILSEEQLNSIKAAMFYIRYTVASDKKIYIVEDKGHQGIREKTMYQKENMLPTLLTQRKKLRELMTLKDKEAIKKLRVAYQEAQSNFKQFQDDHQYQMISAAGFNEVDGKQYDDLQKEMMKKYNDINDLVAKYDKNINALFEEIAPQMKKWEADLEAIEFKYFPKRKEIQAKWSEIARAEAKENNMAAFKFRFMCLDDENLRDDESTLSVKLNYFKTRATLDIELEKAGMITLVLVDKNDQIVQKILTKNLKTGSHTMTMDFLDLESGQYAFVLTTADNQKLKSSFSYSNRW